MAAKFTHEDKVNKLIDWFKEHEDVFNDVIEELDYYNGYLGDDRYYCMSQIDELLLGNDYERVLRMAFFGYDEETWSIDESGDKKYGAFNPNREYFRFNGYGNLVSADYKDYSVYLDKYFVNDLIKNRWDIDMRGVDDEISEILDELEDEKDA